MEEDKEFSKIITSTNYLQYVIIFGFVNHFESLFFSVNITSHKLNNAIWNNEVQMNESQMNETERCRSRSRLTLMLKLREFKNAWERDRNWGHRKRMFSYLYWVTSQEIIDEIYRVSENEGQTENGYKSLRCIVFDRV